ncbi:MAG TPA: alpha/beta fold hydrolase [bacterium]|nr:alpha/beta fold hydrolase [bacterium]
MKTIAIIVISLIALYFGLSILIYFFQRLMVYHPEKTLTRTPATVGIDFEDVTIRTGDGKRIHGWFLPHESPRAVVLYLHGNAGNISDRVDSIRLLHALRLSVYIIDYRGYGKSTGNPTETGTYRDAEAAWNYLTEHRKIPSDQISIYGRSLGGAVAIWLAAHYTPRALMVGSTFSNIRDIARDLFPGFPAVILSRIRYNSEKHIRQVQCPVLIMHSREDDLIPFRHGKNLYEAAHEPKSFLELRGGHGESIFVSRKEYMEGIERFLSRHVEAPAGEDHG